MKYTIIITLLILITGSQPYQCHYSCNQCLSEKYYTCTLCKDPYQFNYRSNFYISDSISVYNINYGQCIRQKNLIFNLLGILFVGLMIFYFAMGLEYGYLYCKNIQKIACLLLLNTYINTPLQYIIDAMTYVYFGTKYSTFFNSRSSSIYQTMKVQALANYAGDPKIGLNLLFAIIIQLLFWLILVVLKIFECIGSGTIKKTLKFWIQKTIKTMIILNWLFLLDGFVLIFYDTAYNSISNPNTVQLVAFKIIFIFTQVICLIYTIYLTRKQNYIINIYKKRMNSILKSILMLSEPIQLIILSICLFALVSNEFIFIIILILVQSIRLIIVLWKALYKKQYSLFSTINDCTLLIMILFTGLGMMVNDQNVQKQAQAISVFIFFIILFAFLIANLISIKLILEFKNQELEEQNNRKLYKPQNNNPQPKNLMITEQSFNQQKQLNTMFEQSYQKKTIAEDVEPRNLDLNEIEYPNKKIQQVNNQLNKIQQPAIQFNKAQQMNIEFKEQENKNQEIELKKTHKHEEMILHINQNYENQEDLEQYDLNIMKKSKKVKLQKINNLPKIRRQNK